MAEGDPEAPKPAGSRGRSVDGGAGVEHPARARLRAATLALVAAWLWLLLFASNGGHPFDLSCWQDWSGGIAEHGLGGVYETPGLDYLPGFLWVLAALNFIAGGPIGSQVWLVKAAALTADLLLAIGVARLLARRGRDPLLALLLFLNPALLYNSWVWGQVDGLLTALVGGSALALVAGRPALGVALAVLALNVKPQAIAFLPHLGFLLLHVAGTWRRDWLRILATLTVVQLAVLAPFLLRDAGDAILRVVVTRVGHYPVLSMNAYNVWYFASADPMGAPDLVRVGGVTYRAWGVAAFLAASVAIALPWIGTVRRRWRAYSLDHIDRELFLTLGVAGLAFFLLPTQMHERYLHPAVALLGVDAVLRGRFALYAWTSAAYLLNLEGVLRWRGIPDALLRPRPIAVALLAAFVVALATSWRQARAVTASQQIDRA